jgi:hypothetical protein
LKWIVWGFSDLFISNRFSEKQNKTIRSIDFGQLLMKTDKVLLSEKEIVGVGALYRNLQFLAECEYSLTFRKSLISLENARQPDEPNPHECVIVTIMGLLYAPGSSSPSRLINNAIQVGNSFTLHLNEDFLITVSLIPVESERPVYKVFGRILTQQTPYVSAYL